MKSTTSAPSAPLILKVAGYVMLFSSLIDYATLLMPMKWQDDQWLGSTLIQTVDRGVIPLIALVLLYLSSFIESGSFKPEGRNPLVSGRFVTMILSGILGLCFLLAVPLHFTNTNKVANAAIEKIGQETKQAEEAVGAQVQQRLAQMQEQIKDKAKLEQELKLINDAVTTGQFNGQKLDGASLEQIKKTQKDLQKLKEDPNHLQVMAKEASDKELQTIRERKQKVEEQARAEATKTSLRTGLGSLLLATAFSIISWLGITELGILGRR